MTLKRIRDKLKVGLSISEENQEMSVNCGHQQDCEYTLKLRTGRKQRWFRIRNQGVKCQGGKAISVNDRAGVR